MNLKKTELFEWMKWFWKETDLPVILLFCILLFLTVLILEEVYGTRL